MIFLYFVIEQCYFRGKTYDHGESTSIVECTHCVCTDGSMQCKKRDPEKTCPQLTCPLKDQVVVNGECCKVCRGMLNVLEEFIKLLWTRYNVNFLKNENIFKTEQELTIALVMDTYATQMLPVLIYKQLSLASAKKALLVTE